LIVAAATTVPSTVVIVSAAPWKATGNLIAHPRFLFLASMGRRIC
jgi:hypothetical protein